MRRSDETICDDGQQCEKRSAFMSAPESRLGLLIVVSGPSGTGKTTLCRKACAEGGAVFSVSCTTRPPRPGEVDGKDYFFLTEEDFLARVDRGELFEYARVHNRWYGTLKSYVFDNLRRGVDVLMDIDVQGAAQVRGCEDELVEKCLTDIFVMPPSLEELRARLSGRGTDSPEVVELRLKNAEAEMRHWRDYRYCLVSDTRESDEQRFRSILTAERLRSSLRAG
jgi:guanylate kinase